MLTANLDVPNGWVNGTTAVLKRVHHDQSAVVVTRVSDGQERVIDRARRAITDDLVVEQIPLRLAWALTIHKSQGATLDAVAVDIGSQVFDHGQAYVAISRARSLQRLYILDLSRQSFRTHSHVIQFYQQSVSDATIATSPVTPPPITPPPVAPHLVDKTVLPINTTATADWNETHSIRLPDWMMADLEQVEADFANPDRYDITADDLDRWGEVRFTIKLLI